MDRSLDLFVANTVSECGFWISGESEQISGLIDVCC